MNTDKNILTKIYSINYYPTYIEFNEIKSFYQIDLENNTFIQIPEVKKLNGEIHGFYMQYNYKKFLKG
jgi:hypothetical protein